VKPVSQQSLVLGTGAAPPTFPELDLVTEGTPDAWAVFSRDRRYRYLLGRMWEHRPTSTVLVFGMLNPSTAGAFSNDPTVTKCRGFAWRNGAGGLIVCNAAAFITPYPAELATVDDPIGPHNERMIRWAGEAPRMRGVAAWGGVTPVLKRRLERSFSFLLDGPLCWCFGYTESGEPRHPLMLPYATPLVPLDRTGRYARLQRRIGERFGEAIRAVKSGRCSQSEQDRAEHGQLLRARLTAALMMTGPERAGRFDDIERALSL
jgi:hypothetical protein